MEYIKVANVDDLTDGQVKAIKVLGIDVALVRKKDTFFALDGTCLHQGGPLGEGVLDGSHLVCPWHGWEYELETGKCRTMPSEHVKTFDVKIIGKDVLVKI